MEQCLIFSALLKTRISNWFFRFITRLDSAAAISNMRVMRRARWELIWLLNTSQAADSRTIKASVF